MEKNMLKKYSRKILKVHAARLKMYQEAIEFCKEGNEEKALRILEEILNVCTYCDISKDRNLNLDCGNCIIGKPFVQKSSLPCIRGGMEPSREGMREYLSPQNQNTLQEVFQERHDALAIQAEFNLSEEV